MSDFIHRLCRRIDQAYSETIEFAIGDAAELLRIWTFFDGQTDSAKSVIGPMSDDAPFPAVGEHDAASLTGSLVRFVRNRPRHPQLASAIFALAKASDPALKDLFVDILRDSLDRDGDLLFQAMIALGDIGEPVFAPDRRGRGIDEVQRNNAESRAYLARIDETSSRDPGQGIE